MADTIQSKRRFRLTILIVIVLLLVGGIFGLLYFHNLQQGHRLQTHRQKGLAAYQAGNYEKAVEHLEPLAGSGQAKPGELIKYAEARLHEPMKDNAQIAHAIRALQDALSAEPDNLKAGHRLLDLLSAYNLHSDALETADKVLDAHPDDLEAGRTKTRALLALTRLDEARSAAQQVIDTHPKEIRTRLLLLQARRQLDARPSLLVAQATEWQAQFPKDPRFSLPVAVAQEYAGNRQKALQALGEAADAEAVLNDPAYASTVLSYLDGFKQFQASLALLKRASRITADKASEGQGKNPNQGTDDSTGGSGETSDPSAQAQPPAPPPTDQAENEKASAGSLAGLRRELVRRLFEAGQFGQVLATLEKLPASQVRAATLALKALSLSELDQANKARATRQRLAKLDDDGAGQAWAKVLNAMQGQAANNASSPAKTEQLVKTIEDSLEAAHSHPYLHYFLGQALAKLDRYDEAAKHWRQAMERRSAWAAPRVRLARLALGRDEQQKALGLAEQAMIRQPNNLNAAVTYVLASAEGADTADRQKLETLLDQTKALQKAMPGEPYTKLLSVALNAQLGNKQTARALGGELLNRDPMLNQKMLVRLANISRQYELGLQDRAYALINEHYGSTPSLAMVQALDQAQQGKPKQGLAKLEKGIESAKPGDTKKQWRLAKAQFLKQTDPKQARQYWMQLGKEMAGDAEVQRKALKQNWVIGEHQFMGQTLRRLKKAAGEDDLTWRTQRARFLLSESSTQKTGTGSGSSPDAAAAANKARQELRANADQAKMLLQPVLERDSDSLAAQLLMATAEQRLGHDQAALRHLSSAESISSGNPRVALKRARLELNLGRRNEARQSVQRAMNGSTLSPVQRAGAAALYAALGQTDQAITLLEQLRNQNQLFGGGLRQLARLYLRTDQPDKALALRKSMMQTPSSSDVLLLASIYRREDQPKQAEQMLKRLKEFDLTAADRQTLLGSHYVRFGMADQAEKHFRSAVDQAPGDAVAWERLVRFELSRGEPKQALASAKQALSQIDQSSGLEALIDRAALVRASANQPIYRPLFVSLVSDASNRPVLIRAIDQIRQAREQHQSMADLAASMGELARTNRDVRLVQLLAARLLGKAGRIADAADLAKQTMQRFTGSAEAAALAAETLLEADRFNEALVAANRLRDRSNGRSPQADVFAAQAQTGLGNPQVALSNLRPYMDRALARPSANPSVINAYIRALIGAGQTAKARQTLKPLLGESPGWQNLWISVAANDIDPPQLAIDWLSSLDSRIGEDQSAQRTVQTHGFWTLAKRTGNQQALKLAADHAQQLVSGPNPSGRSWMLRGLIAESAQDLNTAANAYDKALKAEPNNLQVKNNLAMVLARQGSDLDRAVELARQVVQDRPRTPNYLDTLARTLAHAGQCDRALQTIDKAANLDPGNTQWTQARREIEQICTRK